MPLAPRSGGVDALFLLELLELLELSRTVSNLEFAVRAPALPPLSAARVVPWLSRRSWRIRRRAWPSSSDSLLGRSHPHCNFTRSNAEFHACYGAEPMLAPRPPRCHRRRALTSRHGMGVAALPGAGEGRGNAGASMIGVVEWANRRRRRLHPRELGAIYHEESLAHPRWFVSGVRL